MPPLHHVAAVITAAALILADIAGLCAITARLRSRGGDR